MIKDSIAEMLHKVEIFKNIPADFLNILSKSLFAADYKKDTPIIHKGEEGDSMYIILKGKVKIHDDSEMVDQGTSETAKARNRRVEFNVQK